MSTAHLAATGDLASEIHALLRETDPVRWTAGVAERARVRWARIKESVRRSTPPPSDPPLVDAVAHIARLVDESTTEPENEPRHYWMELRERLMPAYERLAAALRARSLRAPTLRPTNWFRIGFHVTAAVVSLLLLEVFLSHRGTLLATGGFALFAWILETARMTSPRANDFLMNLWFFRHIRHPQEAHRVNSATWYGTALLLLAIISPTFASAAALAVLGVGDPLAGLVGRRWGRRAIGGGRTLEGSIAFVVGAGLAAFLVLSLWHPAAGWPLLAAVALAASLAGAVTEAVTRRMDDNFVVPLAAAAAAWATGAALGLTLG